MLDQILIDHPSSKHLVLSPGSSMSSVLMAHDSNGYCCSEADPKRVLVTLITSGEDYVGWSWWFHYNRQMILWIFIKPEYRRQGFGSALYDKAREEARKRKRALRVEPWDRRSTEFFSSVRAKERWYDTMIDASEVYPLG